KAWSVPLLVCHVVEAGSRFEGEPDLATAAVRSVLPDPTVEAEILVADGAASEAIVDRAIEHDCGLIVTGVAHLGHIGDVLVGTTVDRIVREAACPVLIAKHRPHANYRSVLVATDFSTCSRYALVTAARMFAGLDIHLVHAFHVPFEGILSVKDNIDE